MQPTSLFNSSQQARYRAILDQAVGGMVLGDLSGRFLLVNKRWCDMLGYTMAEMLELSIVDLAFQHDRAEAERNLSTLVQDRASVEVEKRYRRKDGSGVWLSLSVSTVHDDAGNPDSIMALATDITERKARAALNAFLADLAERVAPVWNAEQIMLATARSARSHVESRR